MKNPIARLLNLQTKLNLWTYQYTLKNKKKVFDFLNNLVDLSSLAFDMLGVLLLCASIWYIIVILQTPNLSKLAYIIILVHIILILFHMIKKRMYELK